MAKRPGQIHTHLSRHPMPSHSERAIRLELVSIMQDRQSRRVGFTLPGAIHSGSQPGGSLYTDSGCMRLGKGRRRYIRRLGCRGAKGCIDPGHCGIAVGQGEPASVLAGEQSVRFRVEQQVRKYGQSLLRKRRRGEAAVRVLWETARKPKAAPASSWRFGDR